MPPSLSVRALRSADHAEARALLAAAFAGESFAFTMFGDDPARRFAGMRAIYTSWPAPEQAVGVVTVLADAIVGTAVASLPGDCSLCDRLDPTAPMPEEHAARIDEEFHRICRASHLAVPLPPHARVAAVGAHPAVAGAGAGSATIEALLAALRGRDARCVVLECLTTAASFYARFGFEAIDEFDDPGGPGLRSNLMRLYL